MIGANTPGNSLRRGWRVNTPVSHSAQPLRRAVWVRAHITNTPPSDVPWVRCGMRASTATTTATPITMGITSNERPTLTTTIQTQSGTRTQPAITTVWASLRLPIPNPRRGRHPP